MQSRKHTDRNALSHSRPAKASVTPAPLHLLPALVLPLDPPATAAAAAPCLAVDLGLGLAEAGGGDSALVFLLLPPAVAAAAAAAFIFLLLLPPAAAAAGRGGDGCLRFSGGEGGVFGCCLAATE
jgi:hypothetical protein